MWRSDGNITMGATALHGSNAPAARGLVPRRQTDGGRSRARRARQADPVPTASARHSAGTTEAVGRRPAAIALAAPAAELGRALCGLPQLSRARAHRRARDEHALPQVQRPLRDRLGQLLTVLAGADLYIVAPAPGTFTFRTGASDGYAVRPHSSRCPGEAAPGCLVSRAQTR